MKQSPWFFTVRTRTGNKMKSVNSEKRPLSEMNSRDWARVVRAVTFFFVCLFAALSFAGCSQRAKDDADRKAIVGDWNWVDGPAGIRRFSSDGTYWRSNKIMNNPPFHSRVSEGKWNITNGELVITTLMISWDGLKKDPPVDDVGSGRIVRLTGQELVLSFDVSEAPGTHFYVTNIFRRAK